VPVSESVTHMLTDSQFYAWCDGLRLPSSTVELIQKIRTSPPWRNVGGGGANVCGEYPSEKMQRMIQFDSHTVEFPFVLSSEIDRNVLEYYCQPRPPIPLRYLGPTGKKVTATHTPDYFRICRDGAGWWETKPTDKLPALSIAFPNRYVRSGDHWDCPPGREFAEPLGLCYHVHSSDEISPIFTRNAYFLDDFFRVNGQLLPEAVAAVRDCMREHPVLTLRDLIELTDPKADADCIFRMIATYQIWVDLSATPLVKPDLVRVFADEESMVAFHASADLLHIHSPEVVLEAGVLVMWDGRPLKVANVGSNNLAFVAENSTILEISKLQIESLIAEGRLSVETLSEPQEHQEVVKRLTTAHPDEIETANKIAGQIQAYLSGESNRPSNVPERTWQLWVAKYRQAEDQLGYGYVGIIPRIKDRGNRTPKLSEEVATELLNHIKADYETGVQPKRFESHARLRKKLEKLGLRCPSYKTFCAAVGRRPRYAQILARQGSKAAYKVQEQFHFYLERTTPRHGDRPWEIVHIDHTEWDVELRDPETGKVLGRPWLTMMTDACTRKVLAHHLTFDPPSYRSCMMVIRDCVRRHNRLPQILVMDRGKELRGCYWKLLLSFYKITPKWRPRAKGRFGSPLERLFGVSNTEFIYNLRGNTQITKNVRQITDTNDPKRNAIWDLENLDVRLNDFFYETYEKLEHPALGQSPREAFIAGTLAAEKFQGKRDMRRIPYNFIFLLTTAPSTSKGTAKVFAGQGVTINYFNYWSDAFRDPTVEGTNVHVRYDPFDLGIAWAFVKGRWVECISQYYSVLHGKSERALRIACTLLRQRRRRSARARYTVNARELAEFLSRVEDHEQLLLQVARDHAAKAARNESVDHRETQPSSVKKVACSSNESPSKTSSMPVGDPADIYERL
jgi:putative transposase